MKQLAAVIIAIILVLCGAILVSEVTSPEQSEPIPFWESRLWDLPSKGASW